MYSVLGPVQPSTGLDTLIYRFWYNLKGSDTTMKSIMLYIVLQEYTTAAVSDKTSFISSFLELTYETPGIHIHSNKYIIFWCLLKTRPSWGVDVG